MKKYTVYNINRYKDGARLYLRDAKKNETNLVAPEYFIEGIRVGDKLRALGDVDSPVVWAGNRKLMFAVRPESDCAIRMFVSDYLTRRDTLYLQYVLLRSLSASGIQPSFSVTKNLQRFLHNQLFRIR